MSSTNSPFEQSVRGAAYIYTSKSGSKSIRPPPVGPVPPPSDQTNSKLESGSPNSNSHRPPSASSTAITTTASEAIKLALKKLSERNLQDKETQRVSHLAQQLAKVRERHLVDTILETQLTNYFSSIRIQVEIIYTDHRPQLYIEIQSILLNIEM